jgi:predicted Rossmann-fold nucleotide-binding protein
LARVEFSQLAHFLEWSQEGHSFDRAVLLGLDLRGCEDLFAGREVCGLLLLGCQARPALLADLMARGALIFPGLPGLPYRVFRSQLYTVEELFDPPALMEKCRRGVSTAYAETLDGIVYQHFCDNGRSRPHELLESLAQRLHDHSITDGIETLIAGKAVVGIMGGHSMQRSDPAYRRIAFLARTLCQDGFFLISGGGPGAMEACHLGAHFVDRGERDLEGALALLASAPDFHAMNSWLLTGLEVKEQFPAPDPIRARSLGVPTWHYGHEPPNVFASHIGKYFSNSVREDGLVTVAAHGLIFAPGSAGTIQEIFQDQTQNYYLTEGLPSPMILLGDDYWKWRRPIYPLLCSMAAGRPYDQQLYITDSCDRVVEILKAYRELRKTPPDRP